MKKTINFNDFEHAFIKMGRNEQFTYEAMDLIFAYYEQYEIDTGEEVELDVIAICCDITEDSIDNIIDNYNIDISDCENESDKHELVSDYLSDNTILLGETSPNNYVYFNF